MNGFQGKVAVVTGAAAGIGAATAAAFAHTGARVVVADIDGAGAEARAKAIHDAGGSAIGVGVDIGDETAVRAMIERAVEAFGGVDFLHNNASAMDITPRDVGVAGMEREVWDRTLQVNLTGSMLCSKYALPHMIARGGGAIVFTSSNQALLGDTGQTAYAATKYALIALMRSIATQHGRHWIRANVICPGLIMTDRLKAKLNAAAQERLIRHHLLPRTGTPEDIANTVVFLCSDQASFITGQVLSVDGGAIAHQPSYADGGNIKRE
ncbi:MAG: SDR family NAD(P)-dependent oxidoreductase [Gammaproteobacteria bacterium]